jgi:hypothetical protein
MFITINHNNYTSLISKKQLFINGTIGLGKMFFFDFSWSLIPVRNPDLSVYIDIDIDIYT